MHVCMHILLIQIRLESRNVQALLQNAHMLPEAGHETPLHGPNSPHLDVSGAAALEGLAKAEEPPKGPPCAVALAAKPLAHPS
mmetsp:Transcript_128675/g.240636  ORF Transcript_128675/g.240636 Transcript_128675/m.240636 type:complete len:83 (+) Transcript_128675:1-249(+)